MCSLENRARNHLIYPYDPNYVETMSSDDYDPHINLAEAAGLITKEEVKFFKWYKKNH